MKTEKVYPKGIIAFKPNEKAPEFVKGSVLITPTDLIEWLKENDSYMTDYKGKSQIKLQLLENEKGLYFCVDTFSPKTSNPKPSAEKSSVDLPF